MSSKIKEIEILTADDAELMRISREGTLSLNLNEMQAIQTHFGTLGRNPTDVEIETIAQTWSEHCVHKTFKSTILYSEEGKAPEQIDGLFPSFIQRATEEIAKPWCVSVFSDNAGIYETSIIRFTALKYLQTPYLYGENHACVSPSDGISKRKVVYISPNVYNTTVNWRVSVCGESRTHGSEGARGV